MCAVIISGFAKIVVGFDHQKVEIILFWYGHSSGYRDSVVVIGQGLHHILLE